MQYTSVSTYNKFKLYLEGGALVLNLKSLRTERGMSQQALADKFNLSQQSIYKYEHNLAEPDITTLKNFAGYFNVTIDYLVGFSDTPNAESADEEITTLEIEVVKKMRKLSPEVRSSVITLIENLRESRKTH